MGRQPYRGPPGRQSAARRKYILGAGLAACALLSLGWSPLGSGARGAGGAAGSGRAALQAGGSEARLGGRRATTEVSVSADAAAALEMAVTSVEASAAVHGFVTKEGPADPQNWHPDHKAFREQRLQRWLDERQQALAGGQLPPPLPVYTGCQVFVNHLYKIIYLRHAKTASSSLFCHFGGCRAANSSGGDADSSSSQKALSFEPLQVSSSDELDSLWRDYFVVTFVRNPYQRAVSSYRMMARQLALGGAAAQAYSWNEFAADPTGFADTCMADPACKKKGRNFVYVHIQPQHPCIVTASGGWAADFIGRVEHIDEDLTAVLQELEKRRPPEAPPVKPLQGSLANVNGRGCNESAAETGHSVAREQYCQPGQYYEGPHSACFAQIRHHYYADAHSLGYGPLEADALSVQRRRRLGHRRL